MDENEAAVALRKGARAWSRWRKMNPGGISFTKLHLYDSPGRDGRQVKGRNRVDLSGMDLSGIAFHDAFAEGVVARDAVFDGAHFEEGDFSRADFRGATFRNTRFNKTILTNAVFDGATFVNCNLNRVNLVGASFRVREITETVVYGLSAWDLQTSEDSKQSKLVIEKTYGLYSDLVREGKVPMMVDDIELAQFVYYLSNHKKLRDTLQVLNQKGVLLLGRFGDGGLERLSAIRAWLQKQGYMAMVFDFQRPENLSLTETIVTMAGLAKFVVADLSGPSVPAELASILSQSKKPVLAFGDPYALFSDLEDQTRVVMIAADDADLIPALAAKLPAMEALHAARIETLAAREARRPAKVAPAERTRKPRAKPRRS